MRQDAASRRQRTLELLAEGLTPRGVAERLGISLRTVRAYLARPDARDALHRLRAERLRQLAGRALTAAEPALEALLAIAGDDRLPPAARVAAAGRLLDVALRLHEVSDLTERVEALERQLQFDVTMPIEGGKRDGSTTTTWQWQP
jgi:predicted ArsR family transcriptional regulator